MELIAFPYGERNDELAREQASKQDFAISALSTKAQEALGKVEAVSAEADAVEKQAHDLSDLLASLRAQVRLQTPRWQLLEEGKSSFENTLRPFSGQPITVLTCGTTPEPEAYRLGQDVLNFIGKAPGDKSRGANWITGFDVWRRCGPGGGTSYGGNLVTVNNSAGDNVKRAASALKDTLNKLGIYTVEFTPASDPYGNLEKIMGSDSPEFRALSDAKSVFLLVGTNPMFDVTGTSNQTKRK